MPHQAVLDFMEPAMVRVLVVPVGDIPTDIFNKYLAFIKKFGDIKLKDITPVYSGEKSV